MKMLYFLHDSLLTDAATVALQATETRRLNQSQEEVINIMWFRVLYHSFTQKYRKWIKPFGNMPIASKQMFVSLCQTLEKQRLKPANSRIIK